MPAELRFQPEHSRGRRYREPDHPYRGIFQRDRDRVIHSRSFRRLEHKTQVFTSPHSDHFRNRLTHTLEVSQVARTAAAALSLNEDLVECLALAHDLGHPAFGHAGEKALDEEMRCYGANFDHNRHTLRIVEYFEQRYAAFRGLNLTFEVREGLAKHSRELDPTDKAVEEYLPHLRPILEAQLIDPADEIAYNCADLDDAIDCGFISAQQARRQVDRFDEFYGRALSSYPNATARQKVNEAIRQLLNWLVSQFIDGTKAAIAADRIEDADSVRRLDHRIAVLTASGVETSEQLRSLLRVNFYFAESVASESAKAAQKLRELFQYLMDHPADLPDSYQQQLRAAPVHQAVCDYIAGMTDKYLLARHAQVFGL